MWLFKQNIYKTTRGIVAALYNQILLSYTNDSINSCNLPRSSYQIFNAAFNSSSIIYNLDNTYAVAGWYSDGVNKAYWDGAAVTQLQTCTVFSVVLNSFVDGCVNFATSGPVQNTIIVQTSTDKEGNWQDYVGSFTSPRCGFAIPTVNTKFRMKSVQEPSVYSNVISFEALQSPPSQGPACYSVGVVSQPNITENCLGANYTTVSETITITLKDANGNPIAATEEHMFFIVLDVNQCNGAAYTDNYPMSIIPGRSSVSYLNYTTRAVDCGQGNCNEETSYFTGQVIVPINLPNIPTCTGNSAPAPAPPASSTVIVMSTNSPTAGGGTIDFRGGTPNEYLDLEVTLTYFDGSTFGSLEFSWPVSVTPLYGSNYPSAGSVTLDANGNANATYTGVPENAAYNATVRIVSRSSGNPIPTQDTVYISNS